MTNNKGSKKSAKPLNKRDMKKTKGGTLNFTPPPTSTRFVDPPDTRPGITTSVNPPEPI